MVLPKSFCRAKVAYKAFPMKARHSRGSFLKTSSSLWPESSKRVEKWRKELKEHPSFCSRHPEVLWAQRSDKVIITIALPDPIDPKIHVDASGKLTFSAKAGPDKTPYELNLELGGEIDNEVGVHTRLD